MAMMWGTFLFMAGVGYIGSVFGGSTRENWLSIFYLGERILYAPFSLLTYFFNSSAALSDGSAVAPEVTLAIEGRFLGGMADSGILMVFQDFGLLGLTALGSVMLSILLWSTQQYTANKTSSANIYGISTLLFCCGIGLSMRYQVFPVWLIIGTALAHCVAAARTIPSDGLPYNE